MRVASCKFARSTGLPVGNKSKIQKSKIIPPSLPVGQASRLSISLTFFRSAGLPVKQNQKKIQDTGRMNPTPTIDRRDACPTVLGIGKRLSYGVGDRKTPVLRVDTRSTPTNDYSLFTNDYILFQDIIDAEAGGDNIQDSIYIKFG